MYHSRPSSTNWALANSASTSARGMQWNARSQAAYQGYSHLSGIEMMSALFRCVQSLLRPCQRAARRRRLAGIALQPVMHVVMIELLAPDHAGEGLPLHVAGHRRRAGRFASCRKRHPPRACGRARSDQSRRTAGHARARLKRNADRARCRRPESAAGRCAAALVPCRAGFTRLAVAMDEILVKCVLEKARLGRCRTTAGCWSRFRKTAVRRPNRAYQW